MTDIVYNKNGVPFDIDALATDVNGKADKDLINVSSNASVCIESWHEGTEWYRVYSDGWCEQGGIIYPEGSTKTITFLKPFVDTNYNLSQSYIRNSDSNPGTVVFILCFYNKTTTSVQANGMYDNASTVGYVGGSNECFSWYACGYIR